MRLLLLISRKLTEALNSFFSKKVRYEHVTGGCLRKAWKGCKQVYKADWLSMKNSGTILGHPQGYILGVGVMIVMFLQNSHEVPL